MLFTILGSGGEFIEKLLLLLMLVFALLPAFTLHEWAHGYAAYKLGDTTAKIDGRLSLNPLAHIDPFGALMLLVFGFGWAKPVPVRTRNLKNPKRDFAICSAAGPLMNFVLATVSAVLLAIAWVICYKLEVSIEMTDIIAQLFLFSIQINISLGLFNLIPLPPLDGSNIVAALLPNRIAAKYLRVRYYTHYIFIALILLSRSPAPLSQIADMIWFPLEFASSNLYSLLVDLANAIIRIFI